MRHKQWSVNLVQPARLAVTGQLHARNADQEPLPESCQPIVRVVPPTHMRPHRRFTAQLVLSGELRSLGRQVYKAAWIVRLGLQLKHLQRILPVRLS
jgi:hypothetical protein